jgi:hypothetical protein
MTMARTTTRVTSATVDEVDDWLAGVTYKDGVGISAELGAPFTIVVVRYPGDDSRGLKAIDESSVQEPITVTHRFPLPLRSVVGDRRAFLNWLRHTLGRVELHERDEWLLVDGRRIFDPHA